MTDNRPVTALALTRGPAGAVLAVLDRDGEEARIVGGAVRNALLGMPPGDIDIATTALPNEIIRRTSAAGFRPVATGIEHGTVTVVADGVPFEVTTLRQDIETYGRRAKVVFGRDWRLDAQRRDFTINALFLSRDGAIHDYVGGGADLAAHRVRFIGDPATRIAEDYLRILRFFRFHASYGEGAPDPAGLAAGIRARERIASLSRERVRMELMKLLVAPRCGRRSRVMTEAGFSAPCSAVCRWWEVLRGWKSEAHDRPCSRRLSTTRRWPCLSLRMPSACRAIAAEQRDRTRGIDGKGGGRLPAAADRRGAARCSTGWASNALAIAWRWHGRARNRTRAIDNGIAH